MLKILLFRECYYCTLKMLVLLNDNLMMQISVVVSMFYSVSTTVIYGKITYTCMYK